MPNVIDDKEIRVRFFQIEHRISQFSSGGIHLEIKVQTEFESFFQN
jgi:hypothetical protein